jgi:hypothetical protein
VERTPLQVVLDAITTRTGTGQLQNGQWRLHCPAHPDRNSSLGLAETPAGHALLYCQAGCRTEDVLASVDLQMRDLYPITNGDRREDPIVATYPYVDETGQLLYQVLRTANKRFMQRRPDPTQPTKWIYKLDDTRRVLYRLPAVLQAIREGQTIYLVEGEKDVHTVEQDGCVGTCNPGGAGKWRPEYTDQLRGAHLVIVADIDPTGVGMRHARTLHQQLQPVAASLLLCQPAAGKDTTDHRLAGFALDELTIVDPNPPTPTPQAVPLPPEAIDGPPEPVSPATTDMGRARIRLTPASAFTIKPVRWVWDGRMPLGEICLIAGREGVGKSTFLAWLTAAITNGNLPGVYEGEPRAVLYSASEDAWSYTIAPRMVAAGANLDLVYRIDTLDDDGTPGKLILPRDSRYLPEIAEETKAAALMCDPILSLVDGRINPNQAQELRSALEPLKHAAETAGIVVPALVHFNKTRDVDILSMIAGSRSWSEVARAALAIAEDKEAEEYTCVVSQGKNNLGRRNLPNLLYTIDDVALETEDGPPARVGRLRWTGETELEAEEVLQRKPASQANRDNVNRTQAAILDWLDEQGRACSPREVADGLPDVLNYENAKKTLARLASRGVIQRVGTGLYRTEPAVPAAGTGSTPMRTRDPIGKTVPVPRPSQGGWKGGAGTKTVPGERAGTGQVVGAGQVVPDVVRSCTVCYGPLIPVEPGQTTHPTCQPQPPGDTLGATEGDTAT